MSEDTRLQRMGREQFRTADGDVAAEFDRVCQLFQLALGKPSDRVLFDSLMGEASEKGLNWVQGLEYVIRRRDEEPEPANGGVIPFEPRVVEDLGLRRVS